MNKTPISLYNWNQSYSIAGSKCGTVAELENGNYNSELHAWTLSLCFDILVVEQDKEKPGEDIDS